MNCKTLTTWSKIDFKLFSKLNKVINRLTIFWNCNQFLLVMLMILVRDMKKDIYIYGVLLISQSCKDLFETKLKKCAYLKPISSHFIANYMIVFHKNEVQKIILICLMGLNSKWLNSYDTEHKYFHFRFFAILYKNTHLYFLCFCVLCHNFCTS